MMDNLSEETQGLIVESVFNISLLIIIGKSPSFQSFFEWIEDAVVTRCKVRAVRGMFENFPEELLEPQLHEHEHYRSG
ncbi:hypothetical protein TNCV_710911 [Trichonephila clavipes]|nr:hypothetical protein TNCV_710911 [Trichonephila clavipes]